MNVLYAWYQMFLQVLEVLSPVCAVADFEGIKMMIENTMLLPVFIII